MYPAIAIADALRRKYADVELLFVGTRNHMEWEAVPRAGYDITDIWISGFHRRLTLKNLLFPVKLATSIVQAFNIISDFDPRVVIACGGYVSGPVGWVAAKRGIPLLLQEQNSFPGVTTRMLARDATKIFTAFREADHYLPEHKTKLTGNPTRKKLKDVDRQEALTAFGFSEHRKTLLVLGGSGGAKKVNDAMSANIEKLHDGLGLQIIWQCGSRYYDELHMKLDTENYERLRLVDFLHRMPEAYEVADLVVSRAGALSCSELALTGKASILIPSPNVAGDHQTMNAQALVDAGAAEMLRDEDAIDLLGGLVEQVITDDDKLKSMQRSALEMARPDASDQIAEEIFQIAKEQANQA